MPAVARTSDALIIAAARTIIEQSGVDGLSMSSLAEAVGIRAPSLYKRFASREAIVRVVKTEEFGRLGTSIEAAVVGLAPVAALREIARQYWRLAHERPALYALLFSPEPFDGAEERAVRAKALLPLLDASRALIGNDLGLAAARTLTAYIHGFLAVEAAGAFRPTKITEGSYFFGLSTIIKGLTLSA